MAVTKIWDIKGFIGKVIIYAENPKKTIEVREAAYTESERSDMTDVMDHAMLDERAKEFEHWRSGGIDNVLGYATQDYKTEEKRFVSALNCTPENARENMMLTKKAWQKLDGISAFHGYQAFRPGEVSPDTAHEIGVKLAQKLWGDRFEVVIATHLDRGHIHNHFVLNSVSFADGLKYNDCNATYMKMRRESDALCREYRLSIVEEPKRGSAKHYSEWVADKLGKPTYRSMVKSDVDTAIRRSMTERQFFENLQKMGYHIKYGQDITIRPEGKDRGLKLCRNFGDDYSIEAIRRRILAQARPERHIIPADPPLRKLYLKESIHSIRKVTGLCALYFYYLYRMGALSKKQEPNPKKVYFLFREDIRHMQDMAKEIRLMVNQGINNTEQLSMYKTSTTDQIIGLSATRKHLRNQVRSICDEDKLAAVKTNISELSVQITQLRKEVRLCENIEIRSLEIKDKIQRARDAEIAEKTKTKELKRDEPFRRRR